MLKILEKIIKQSEFKSWTTLQSKFGYSNKGRASLKQRVSRNIAFINNILQPLGYKLTLTSIENDDN